MTMDPEQGTTSPSPEQPSGKGSVKQTRRIEWLVVLALIALACGVTGTVLGTWAFVDVRKMDQTTTSTTDNDAEKGPTGGDDSNENGVLSTLEAIVKRGTLNCGLPFTNSPGFLLQVDGEFVGFDVELCKAISAAIFGEPNFTPFPMTGAQRWGYLKNKQVDLVMRSTHNMERDVFEPSVQMGFDFSAPYIYDGLGFAGKPDFVDCADNVNVTGTCGNLLVCVDQGTTHYAVIRQLFPERHIRPMPDQNSFYNAFKEGTCNVLAWEQAGIVESTVRSTGYKGPYAMGKNFFSREPLAIASRQDDAQWSDFVNWIIQALFAAEEQGISRITYKNFKTTNLFGDEYEFMFHNALKAVGNYGEIYTNTLQAFQPRDGMNRINNQDSGLMYSFPFGPLDATGLLAEKASPTIQAIKERGFLQCGVNVRKGFAEFDPISREWSGFDVDLCRALSAAIFDGVDHVVYTNLPAAQRFEALASGSVDCLARLTTWTLARDIKEPTTGQGLSFSSPYFYDGVTFGGVPPFSICAENLDVISPECQELQFCVLDGTTALSKVTELFHEKYVIVKLTFEEVIDGLNDGTCNAIAGGFHDVALATIEERGYTGPYEVGIKRFSKDPLSIATREGDPIFSDFVRWVFWGLVQAEENGITKESASEMVRTKLFGPLRTTMFYHAVNAVGNYGEMYDRNFASLIPRGGPHALNENGPQLFALAGL